MIFNILPLLSFTLLGAPEIYTEDFFIYVNYTLGVILPCNHMGRPSPSVYWTTPNGRITAGKQDQVDKNGRQIGRKGIWIMPNGSLNISSAKDDDTGSYKCVVANRFGNKTLSVKLDVFRGKMQGYLTITAWTA